MYGLSLNGCFHKYKCVGKLSDISHSKKNIRTQKLISDGCVQFLCSEVISSKEVRP